MKRKGWEALTLPERSLFAGVDVDLSQAADVKLVRVYRYQDWLLVHAELLRAARVWEVQIFLEGNTEGNRDDLVGVLGQDHALTWRLADQVLVVEDLTFHDQVVFVRAELAPSVLPELVIEALACDEDVGVLADGSHVRVHASDSVRMHGEVTGGPGVRVERCCYPQALSFLDERQLVVEGAPDGLGIEELSRGEDVADSAGWLGVLEVVAEVASDDVDGTFTVVWCDCWSH